MRALAFAVIGLAVASCEMPETQLWPGPDWRTPASAPGSGPAAASSEGVTAASGPAAQGDETSTRVARERTRRGSGTPPDILFPQTEARPTVVQPEAPPAVAPADTSNPVLAPRDPKAPYSAGGFGYQRQGTNIQGPTGENYNMVGSSVFGPRGSSCHAVGNSLFCN